MSDDLTSVILLALLSLFGIYFAFRLSRSSKTVLNIRSLVVLNYIIIYPISGIVHLLEIGSARGYFELAHQPDYVWRADLAVIFGMLFLLLGTLRGSLIKEEKGVHLIGEVDNRDVIVAILTIVLTAPAAIYGLVRVNEIASSLEVARLVDLKGGTARYAFMSHWMVWIATFSALVLFTKLFSKRPILMLLTFVGATAIIAASLLWSGGRSIVLLMAFPLVMLVAPRLRHLRSVAALVGGFALAAYVVAVSEIRSNSLYSGRGVDVGNWLDWEWGRYSIIGTVFQYVDVKGYLYGETVWSGIVSVLFPLFSMFGMETTSGALLTSTNITSVVLFGNYQYHHVVPGLTAELYLNGGMLGVAVGYFAVGYGARWVDEKLGSRQSAASKILLLFVGGLLIFRCMQTGITSFLFYLLYSGAPLFFAAAATKMIAYYYRQIHKQPAGRSRSFILRSDRRM